MQRARQIVEEAIGEPLTDKQQEHIEARPTREKNAAAVALGRLGGLKGGKARANKLTQEQKKAIASRAAKARWLKKKPD